MSKVFIYKKLISLGCSVSGACAIMGNLQAESALQSNNVEDRCHLPDETYTEQVDNGTYTDFTTDAYGYGLAQWTYYARKQNLLNFAKSKGVSISDEGMQCEFLINELKSDYPNLWLAISGQTDATMYALTDRICREFERPAVNNVSQRMSFAARFYSEFGQLKLDEIVLEPETKEEVAKISLTKFESYNLQAMLAQHDFLKVKEIDGIVGSKTISALEKFCNSLKESIKT